MLSSTHPEMHKGKCKNECVIALTLKERTTAAPCHSSCNLPETADGNGADWAGSDRTWRTVGAANISRMWKAVHEVLLDTDNRLLLMKSLAALQWSVWEILATGLWLQVVLILRKRVHT